MFKYLRKQRKWFGIGCLLCLWWMGSQSVFAVDLRDSLDFSDVQQAIDEMLPKEMPISFSDVVEELAQGNIYGFIKKTGTYIVDSMEQELKNNKKLLAQVIGIVIVSAVFTNFSMAFSKTYIAETGFYLTYLILLTLLLTSFMTTVTIAEKMLDQMTRFMSALVPVFSLSVMLTGNIQTGIWYQQVMVAVVAGIQWMISKGALSLVRFFVILSMVNQLSKEDVLSKCTELMKTVVGWTTKTALGFVIGLNMIQGMILPAFDTLKTGWTSRVVSTIPGIGNVMGGVVKTLGGSAVLIKNSVGAGGLLILAVLFLIPSVKLVLMALMTMVSQVILQPVADKRMIESIQSVSEGTLLLLKIEGTVFVLFFVSMAMMISISGTAFGG